MRAFIPFDEGEELNHPEDVKKIISYLEVRGTINVKPKTLENLWYDFSDEASAGWLTPEEIWLERFVDYIIRVDY